MASLLRHGLVQGSFIPPRDIRELPDLTRRRRTLVGDGAAERNRIQKVLEDANASWAMSCRMCLGLPVRAMLEALLENKQSPSEIAELGHWSLAPKIPQIIEALEGHRETAPLDFRDKYKRGSDLMSEEGAKTGDCGNRSPSGLRQWTYYLRHTDSGH